MDEQAAALLVLQQKAKRKGGLEFPAERTTSTLTRSRHGLRRGLVETIFVRLSKPFVYRIRSDFEFLCLSNAFVFRTDGSQEREVARMLLEVRSHGIFFAL